MSVLIRRGRIVTAADDYVADLYVEDDQHVAAQQHENDELVASPGIGRFVRRARFDEELKPARAAVAP